MRSYHCQGLNASFLVAAVFDPVRTYRAYAINNLAQLLTLTVPNDNRKTLCKVVRFVQLPQPNAVPGNAEWQMLAMPGYLLLATSGVVAVLNVTSTRSNPHGVVAGSLANMMGCMIFVGLWQFMRAKNRVNGIARHGRLCGTSLDEAGYAHGCLSNDGTRT
ncbi:uncharacterized protein HaLaN_05591 [Haematococcus lacustris]|uniref:Uncharacterized protein n=1 Tax=Haematococcus lacustris TaxID=44745 RepID=A0A699YJM8_HAELA|nr:uncharacterized protein HaLaN_05591 [Haematococcus lacustris]